MADDGKAGKNPLDLWSQWYDTTANMWSRMLSGEKENYWDPYGLYRQWFNIIEENRERLEGVDAGSMPGMGGVPGMDITDMRESMQRWVSKTAETYQHAANTGMDAMRMTPRWMQMMEEVRENLSQVDRVPADPMAAMLQWYNATSGPFGKFVEDIIQREEFLEASSRFFENYTSAYKIMRRASEEYWSNLQLPTRSDIARVATLVIALEDKVDRMEEMLEGLEDAGAAAGEGAAAVESLERRMDAVERKLDRLLAAVEEIQGAQDNGRAPAEEARREIKATDAARRRAQELGVDLAEIEGTGAGGQITVEDVRKRGEG
jgi:polyhydroxyalkanoic acid synthase PhaR subunit